MRRSRATKAAPDAWLELNPGRRTACCAWPPATRSSLRSAETWRAIVLDATLADNGMASFATVLDEQAAEAIRAFVIAQAHATR